MNQITELFIISARQIFIFFLHALFASVSLTPKQRMTKIIYIWGISAVGGMVFAAIPFYWVDEPARTVICYLLAVAIYFVDIKLTFSDSIPKKVFVFSISVGLVALSIAFGVVFAKLFFAGSRGVISVFGVLVYLIAELVYIFLLKSPLRRIELEKESQWWLLTAVVLLYSLSLSAKVVLFDAFGEINVTNLVMDLILAVVLGIVLFFVFHVITYMGKSRELELMAERSRLYETQLLEMKEAERQADHIRHDIRHHNMIVAEYAANRDYEGLMKYIDSYEEESEKRIFHRICENDTANSILNAYLKKAQESGIDTAVSANVSERCPIHTIDLLSLVANVFDNAINGCNSSGREHTAIVFNIREEEGKLLIWCKNTCRDDILFDEDGLPKRRKAGKNHGIGIKSILAVVNQYGGITDFYTEGSTFVCRVALSLRTL